MLAFEHFIESGLVLATIFVALLYLWASSELKTTRTPHEDHEAAE